MDDHTQAAIRAILNQDRVWAAYAFADLQPAFAPFSHWQVAESVEGKGVVLLFTALTPPIVFTMGADSAVRQALREMKAAEKIYITAPLGHYPLLAELYEFGSSAHQMQRMLLTEQSDISVIPTHGAIPGLTRLTVDHTEQVKTLLAQGGEFAPGYFDPYQLRDGVYYGVMSGSEDEEIALQAVGGTHILDRTENIAAIGNMYTHPDQRGNGYGRAVLQAILSTLVEEGFQTIFLNVDLRNPTAHKLYQRYGFTDYCIFMEGAGVRRQKV